MPPIDPQTMAIIQYLLTQGGMSPSAFDTTYGRAPQAYDEYGNLDQSMDMQADQLGFLRNMNTFQLDPATGAQAGTGAFDLSQFQPEVEMEPVDQPGKRAIEAYSQRGGWEGLVAETMLTGKSASEAVGLVNEALNDPTNEYHEQFMASLPPLIDPTTGAPKMDLHGKPIVDRSEVNKFARDLETKFITDPVGNYEEGGQQFNRTETPSKASQYWSDRGLPSPDQRYSIEEMMGPEWQQQTGGVNDPVQWLMARDAAMGDVKQGISDINTQKNDVRRRESQARQGMKAQQAERGGGGGGQYPALTAAIKRAGTPSIGGVPRMQGPPGGRPGSPDYAVRGLQAQQDAMKALIAPEARQQEYEQTFGQDYWRNKGRLTRAEQRGRTPLLDTMMARRMAAIAGGVPGGYYPAG